MVIYNHRIIIFLVYRCVQYSKLICLMSSEGSLLSCFVQRLNSRWVFRVLQAATRVSLRLFRSTGGLSSTVSPKFIYLLHFVRVFCYPLPSPIFEAPCQGPPASIPSSTPANANANVSASPQSPHDWIYEDGLVKEKLLKKNPKCYFWGAMRNCWPQVFSFMCNCEVAVATYYFLYQNLLWKDDDKVTKSWCFRWLFE